MKYRPKDVDIEAIQYDGGNLSSIIRLLGSVSEYTVNELSIGKTVHITTISQGLFQSQSLVFSKGDYVVLGQKEYLVMNSREFEASYDLHEDEIKELEQAIAFS